MQVGDDRRHREAPLEAEGEVDDDADDDQQQRHRAVLGEFLADLRTDEFHPAQGRPRRARVERGHHRLAGLGGRLLGLQRQADQHVAARTEVLHRDFAITRLGHCTAHLLEVGRLRVIHLNQRAAGELDRQVEPVPEEEEDRGDEGGERNDVELQRMAHEGNVFTDAEEFHFFALPYLALLAPRLALPAAASPAPLAARTPFAAGAPGAAAVAGAAACHATCPMASELILRRPP